MEFYSEFRAEFHDIITFSEPLICIDCMLPAEKAMARQNRIDCLCTARALPLAKGIPDHQ